jgi:hypothetical protein
MVDEWQIQEFVNRRLLFFALSVLHKVDGGPQPTIAMPPPFKPGQVEHALEQIVQAPPDRKRGKVESILDRIVTRPPITDNIVFRTVRDVVEWWINAGIAIAPWRATVARSDGGRAAAADRQPSDDPTWLWNAMVRRLRLEDDEEYPPVWLATLEEAWRIRWTQPEEGLMASWDRGASGLDECRIALLEWCGDPGRELAVIAQMADSQPSDRWAVDYHSRQYDFAKSALRLLRQRCRFAPEHAINCDPRYEWRLARTVQSPSARSILRRPMIVGDAVNSRCPGWFVNPWPAVVVAQFRKSVDSLHTQPGSMKRAIAAAEACVGTEDRSFARLTLWDQSGPAAILRRDRSGDVEWIAAIVRLAVIEETLLSAATADGHPPAGFVEPPNLIRESLRVEGFSWRRTVAAAAVRRIPIDADSSAVHCDEGSRIILGRVGAEPILDVGIVDSPSRCPEDLLAAIEEFDWRVWAYSAFCEADDLPKPLADVADAGGWESLKCRLLDLDIQSPNAARELAEAYTLVDTWLAIDATFAASYDDATAVGSLLTNRLHRLAAAMLRLLVEIDPAGQGGLYPPRTVEGRIDLAAWHANHVRCHAHAREWLVKWKQSKERFGVQIGEPEREDDRISVTFSAGESATHEDILALDDMRIASSIGSPWNVLWLPLRTQAVVGLGSGAPPDFAAAIAAVRESWNGEAANAFDELVKRAIDGHRDAIGTLRIFQTDSRFGFTCHPAIDVGEEEVSLRSAGIGDALVWCDDPTVPADKDIEVIHAFDSARARRVVSRGQPTPTSPETCSARFESTTPPGSPARAAAEALRTAIDRRRMFAADAPDPLSAVSDAANTLACCGPGEAWVGEAFAELSGCCNACGGKFIPVDWSPLEGAPADGLEIGRIGFHITVPMGRAVVERFGVTAEDGRIVASPGLYKSAGPEPAGYREVIEKVDLLNIDNEAVAMFRQHVHDLPRRVENGQAKTAIPGLFDVAWDAKQSAPDRADIEAAVQSVHQLLERSFEMFVFRPKSANDVSEGWLRTQAGGVPRGNRVELVRPGVRTRDNKLVRPAIVEAE